MTRIALALATLALVACTHAPPVNKATTLAEVVLDEPACTPLRTGHAKQPDTAICEAGPLLMFCRAGNGSAKQCLLIRDYSPKEEPKGQPQQAPQPSPTATPSPQTSPTPTPPAAPSSPPATPPAPGEAKGDAKKPDTKSGAKK